MERPGRSGFSLVELLVALAFLGVLLGGMVRVLLASLGSWTRVNASLAADRSLRWALDALAEDLRMLGCLMPPPELRPPEGADSAGPALPGTFRSLPGPVTDELSFVLDAPWPAGADGPGLLAVRPLRVVRYAVVPRVLDEPERGLRAEPVPCLVRFETAWRADQAAPRWAGLLAKPPTLDGSWRVVAEHVTGFRVDLGPGEGLRAPFGSRTPPALVRVALEIRGPAPGGALHRRTLQIAPRNVGPGGAGAGREGGGVAILLAFMLLALMAGAGLATSRNLLRELAVAGDARLGDQAAAAAESGLEWFLAWASAAGDRAEGHLDIPPGPPGGLFGEPAQDAARQSCELRARDLGPFPPQAGAEAASGAPGRLWRVTATGRCRVGGPGGPGRVFTQVRELVAVLPLGPAGLGPGEGAPEPFPGPPRVLAWRTGPAAPDRGRSQRAPAP